MIRYSSSEILSRFLDIRSCNDSLDFLINSFPFEVRTIGVDLLSLGSGSLAIYPLASSLATIPVTVLAFKDKKSFKRRIVDL